MLASARARATYAQFQRQGLTATVCRGTTGSDFNFFYSDYEYWSNGCLGWVHDFTNESKICTYCSVTKAPSREFIVKEDKDEFRTELRNSNRVLRQADEPCKPGRSRLPKVSSGRKHSSKRNKGNAALKNKQTNKSPTKTNKKKTKK